MLVTVEAVEGKARVAERPVITDRRGLLTWRKNRRTPASSLW
jgi:hypothetical protein